MFSSLFKSNEFINNVSSGVDKIVLTNEEKLDNFNKLLALYTPFKIAQRFLMLVLCVPYAVAFLVTFICAFFLDVTVQKEMLQGDISMIVGVIVGFYFGGGAVEGVIGRKNGRV
jgi:hypothetical protein